MQQHELPRQLGLFPATNIVVADMIGSGIFTTSGLILALLGNPLLMLALWFAGGVLALCGALCYGALGAAMPRAGGEYAYLSRLFHPLLGFLTGWVSFFVGFSAPLAASSLGLSEYLGRALPELGLGAGPTAAKRAVAVLVIGALAAVHLRGLGLGARVQNVLTVGKVSLILLLIAAGFAMGRGDAGHFTSTITPEGGSGWRAAGLALMWIMFAYSGWNASGYIGSEIREPRRNLPVSLVAGSAAVLLLYLGLNALYLYAVPPGELQGVIAVGGLTAARLFGPGAERLISLLIAFGLLSAISSLIILGPRVYYAMAADGYFFRAVSRVHPVHRVPSTAIVLQCLIATLLVITGTFDQILTYMGFCLGVFPILAVLGVFRLSREQEVPAGVLYPAAVVFAAASGAILVLAYLERPVESTIAVATVLAGVPFYFAFARAKARQEVS